MLFQLEKKILDHLIPRAYVPSSENNINCSAAKKCKNIYYKSIQFIIKYKVAGCINKIQDHICR